MNWTEICRKYLQIIEMFLVNERSPSHQLLKGLGELYRSEISLRMSGPMIRSRHKIWGRVTHAIMPTRCLECLFLAFSHFEGQLRPLKMDFFFLRCGPLTGTMSCWYGGFFRKIFFFCLRSYFRKNESQAVSDSPVYKKSVAYSEKE